MKKNHWSLFLQVLLTISLDHLQYGWMEICQICKVYNTNPGNTAVTIPVHMVTMLYILSETP